MSSKLKDLGMLIAGKDNMKELSRRLQEFRATSLMNDLELAQQADATQVELTALISKLSRKISEVL